MRKTLLVLASIFLAAGLSAQDLGGRIVFSRHAGPAVPEGDSIFYLDNDGQGITYITNGYRPRVSHNGRYMAFTRGPLSNNSYNGQLWLRDLEAMHDTVLYIQYDYLDYYDFSPSDQEIVYSQSCSVYKMNIDGSSNVSIGCNPCNCYSDDPTIRLSDSLLVYHNWYYGLYTAGFDFSNSTQVPNTVAGDVFPIWSPDGTTIAFERAHVADGIVNNLFTIKPDGTDLLQLTNFSDTDSIAPDPVWAQDMESIYFIGRVQDTMGIYSVATDGSYAYSRLFSFPHEGKIGDYWLGLADSLLTGQVVYNACDSLSNDFSFEGTENVFDFQSEANASGGEIESWYWNFDEPDSDDNLAFIESPSHTYTTEGVHNVCLTVTGGVEDNTCTTTVCHDVIVSLPAGVLNEKEEVFRVYPNPAHDFMTVSVPGNFIGKNFDILDGSGRVIMTGQWNNSMERINTSGLSNGVYLIHSENFKRVVLK